VHPIEDLYSTSFSTVWWPSLTRLHHSAPCCCLEKRGCAGEEWPAETVRTVEIVQILRGQHYATNLQNEKKKSWKKNKPNRIEKAANVIRFVIHW